MTSAAQVREGGGAYGLRDQCLFEQARTLPIDGGVAAGLLLSDLQVETLGSSSHLVPSPQLGVTAKV